MSLSCSSHQLRRLAAGVAVALCLTLAAGQAFSEQRSPAINFEHYKKLLDNMRKDNNQRIEILTINEGLLDGVQAVNAAFRERGVRPRICRTWDSDFNFAGPFFKVIGDELMANSRYYTERYVTFDRIDMGMVAVFAMKRRFPCN